MKVVILAGGMGTRLGEETVIKPKPLVEIGGIPILWHIMKYYSYFGHNEFIICLGYKGYMIKEFFMNYMEHLSDISIDFTKNITKYNYTKHKKEPWQIHLAHTGEMNMTGSRIYQIKPYIDNDDTFLLTYGDGLCDANINNEIKFHMQHKKIATILGVNPISRFGSLTISGTTVTKFEEKPNEQKSYINGGFFVLNKKIFNYLSEDSSLIFEQEPLKKLSENLELEAFIHNGFWQCMDTLRDKLYLEKLWGKGNAPWKM